MSNPDSGLPPDILIVDDDPTGLRLLARLLDDAGYRSRPASSGTLALRSARAEPPALVLLDIRMPDMDGYEICRRLKADARTSTVPVLFVSATREEREKVEAFAAGGVDFIGRPYQAEEVLARVRLHLAMHRLRLNLEQQNERLRAAIAERTEAERELREERGLFVAGPTVVFRWRAAEGWPVEYVSPNVKSQFGYDPASFAAAGLPFARLVHPDDLERVGREVRARTERRAESFEQLYRIEHADGGYRWVSDYTVVQRDDSGAVTYYLGYLLDVTDRLRTEAELRDAQAELAQRAEEALRRSEELYGSVLRAATGYSIIGTDVQGRVTVYNEGAELMLGYRADEVVGRELLSRFFDPEELASRAAEDGCEPDGVLFGAARRGQTDSREWTLVRKDGSRLKASITTTAIRESGGSVRGFIGIARDVTGEREMELKLIQSQKMETVGLLAGGVAHDFNNLLTPILGYSEMLLADLSADDPRRSPLQEVKQAAERAKDLTQRLLSFSRKQLIELKPLDLADAIRRFQPILRRTISESIRIDLFLPPSPRLVRADAAQIDQILLNLSINAQDAMPSGGVLRIEVADSPTAAGSPSAASAPVVMLQVSDTGVGMDARTMEHAFEPFYTTKELGKGTGLGLSTVYGIVKQHGGSVDVTSTVGRGTTFRILLPRLDGAEAPVVPLEEPPPRALRDGGTVLVVEDNAAVRALTCHMLEKLGYQTFSAASPEHCREITRTYDGPIDLLLTDMVMPAMNGKALYELLRSIRPELKVLFMSGYSGSIIGRDGVLEGEAPFIHKPFSFDALARKIREALGP